MSKLNDYKELIRELAELLDKSTLSEIEVEEDDFRIRVGRDVPSTLSYSAPPQAPVAPVAAAPVAAAPATPVAAAPAAASNAADHPGAVTAPMVGTAYASPSPDAAAFVKVGDKVKEGDTLLIIEAMKVMNQIPSTKSGTVKEILFSDSQPVEYGEVLCIIE
ncbi:acetyl-CoA carboxylase biotin carboxyl carrier protein [Kordiimonas sp. SCSIO 12610]|uniref:acetyl-CoA carboxylase biotin carboxyl carrier protein n=1 Tax=Kordiimonas sp. SCSIO 12610 TaxID=2829597 RepID=UPI00210B9328|nr:acetyl-CoA carboxylase biotin carboxyl carrier protein [Kordiimonas sp. SCSIO 12610]UTW53838.1 acetyl-CoA carboxylase biotin carboxyl carrier protein [Kordiimonas sp. SCSIO 12610]